MYLALNHSDIEAIKKTHPDHITCHSDEQCSVHIVAVVDTLLKRTKKLEEEVEELRWELARRIEKTESLIYDRT